MSGSKHTLGKTYSKDVKTIFTSTKCYGNEKQVTNGIQLTGDRYVNMILLF